MAAVTPASVLFAGDDPILRYTPLVKRRQQEDPDDSRACYEAALRSLERRWHAQAELQGKLRLKGFSRDAIDDAIRALAAEGWIDDRRYAEAYARDRARRRIGPERIRAELIGAGVENHLAAEAAGSAFEEGAKEAALEIACRKKLAALVRRHGEDYLSTDEGRNKLIGYLLKQGYDYAAVVAAVRGSIRT